MSEQSRDSQDDVAEFRWHHNVFAKRRKIKTAIVFARIVRANDKELSCGNLLAVHQQRVGLVPKDLG